MTNEERAHTVALMAAEYQGRAKEGHSDVAAHISAAYNEAYKAVMLASAGKQIAKPGPPQYCNLNNGSPMRVREIDEPGSQGHWMRRNLPGVRVRAGEIVSALLLQQRAGE